MIEPPRPSFSVGSLYSFLQDGDFRPSAVRDVASISFSAHTSSGSTDTTSLRSNASTADCRSGRKSTPNLDPRLRGDDGSRYRRGTVFAPAQ